MAKAAADKDKKKEKGDKKEKKDKAEKPAKGDKKEKKEKAEKSATPKGADAAPSAAAAQAAAPAAASPYGAGGYGLGGGVFPRVGPFAPPSAASFFGGAGIYGSGSGASGLGHPYLRATAAASSPLLGLPNRWGGPVTASGALLPPPNDFSAVPGTNAVALAQAYQTRLSALSSVAASLLSKRETAVHQLARVQARLAEVSAAREAIESETLADAEAILHRLRAAEAQKYAVLSKDADALVNDVSATDAFYGALTSFQPQVAGGAPHDSPISGLYDPAVALQFMRAYPELCAEADRLSAKTIKTDLDVTADDFEREVANRNELSSRYAALVDLVAAKDRIILQLLKERESSSRERDAFRSGVERAVAGRTANLERQKAEEVEHWVGLADRLTSELNDVTDKLARAQMSTSQDGGDAVAASAAASVASSSNVLGGGAGGRAAASRSGGGATWPSLASGQRTPINSAAGIAMGSGGARVGTDYLTRRLAELPNLSGGSEGGVTGLPIAPE